MSEPDGPEEREAYAQEKSWYEDDRFTIDEQLADESQHWMRNGGVDAMNWPKAISVQPVSTDRLEAQARLMLERIAREGGES